MFVEFLHDRCHTVALGRQPTADEQSVYENAAVQHGVVSREIPTLAKWTNWSSARTLGEEGLQSAKRLAKAVARSNPDRKKTDTTDFLRR